VYCMILVIDNFDSFVYNLARYVGELGFARIVKRNNDIALNDIAQLNPEKIIISPGPCTPNEAGISLEVIKQFGSSIPILGVCLGHQAIGQIYGGEISKAKQPMHGKASYISHCGQGIFEGVKNPLKVGRYHSLIINDNNLPTDLIVTAWSDKKEIMGVQHASFPVYGVQFHPESVLTEDGHKLIKNFLTST